MQKLAILYGASQTVISTFDLHEVLRRIVGLVEDNFNVHHIAILLLDASTNALHAQAQVGWTPEDRRVQLLGEGLIGMSAKLKRPIYSADVSRDPRYVPGAPTTRSELALPLLVREEVVGVLDVQSEEANFFDPETIGLLTLFSTQASTAIQNARLYTLEQRKAAQLQAINQIAKETTGVLELRELFEKLCRQVLRAFAVDHAAVLLNEEGQLRLRAQAGTLTAEEGDAGGWRNVYQYVAESRKSLLSNELMSACEVRCFAESRSELCAPLLARAELLGVLVLGSRTPHAFAPADVSALESVADICATAMQNVRYLQRLRDMAYVDGLTGVHNRRYFDLRIAEEIERAKRYETGVSVILVDLDHFKTINDDYGHLAGDEVLRKVAKIFVKNLRKADVACRYGGEEFALIVPETTGEDALAVAEKLRQEVEIHALNGVGRRLTLTAGVASFPSNGPEVEDLIRAADTALYAGKQGGRNRVAAAWSLAVAPGPR